MAKSKSILPANQNFHFRINAGATIKNNGSNKTVIESGIKNCNELGAFVFESYYVASAEIPNEVEIEKIINIIRND